MVTSQALDRTLSALSDPRRRDILEQLRLGPASITELAGPQGISLPGVLKHVRILEEAHLVVTEKKGRTRECRLGPDEMPKEMEDVTVWIERFRRDWMHRLDRLDAYLERQPKEPKHEKGDA
jgi:DNA-binding transcriptional ArsR family regulator